MKTGYIILLLLLFTACRDQADLPNKDARYPVSFTLPEIAAITRATVAEETALAAGEKVTIAAYNPNTKAFVAQTQYKVNTAGNGLEVDNSSDMFLSAGTYDFCVIVPGQTLTGDGRYGKIGPQVDALGSTTRAQMRSEATTITLDNLKHLASQITFTVRVVKDNTPITAFDVVQIEIEDMVTYTDDQGNVLVDNYRLPENELIIPGVGETERYTSIYIQNDASDPTVDYHENDPSGRTGKHYNIQKKPLIVYPRTNGSFKANIRLKIAEGSNSPVETNVSAKINHLAFEPGKRYLFEVNYGWDFVKFIVTVSPWTTVDNNQGQVGSGEQEVSTSYSVDEWGSLVELGGDLGGA